MNNRDLQKKTALLISGSPQFDIKSFEVIPEIILKHAFIIAIDKGLEFAWKNHISPDLIIGDFDSVDPDLLNSFSKTKKISFPSKKNRSDTEIALNYSLEKKFELVLGINMIGGRLDHDLFNKLLLFKAPDKFWLISASGCLKALSPLKKYKIPVKKGKIFSLIPYSECCNVNLSGCEYPLQNQNLQQSSLTLSNVSDGNVQIFFDSGNLQLFIEDLSVIWKEFE
ncbi:MAG: thiamine diphosphokinase [Candidatus Lokiarchaeota archaeon]|nr:thiamine diphosphokinase [Candidatus Harpocratesius repetitus]